MADAFESDRDRRGMDRLGFLGWHYDSALVI